MGLVTTKTEFRIISCVFLKVKGELDPFFGLGYTQIWKGVPGRDGPMYPSRTTPSLLIARYHSPNVCGTPARKIGIPVGNPEKGRNLLANAS